MTKQMILPKDVSLLLETLRNNGYEAYIVGGCVRDAILSRIPQDWDITTSALPEQTKALFPHTFDTGIQHGTITVVCNKVNYEITTYRIDGHYLDSRHPEQVCFTPNLEEDLLRRDFTMNAIAYHPEEGFKDPFGGQQDIQNGCIRGVGNPTKRFQEDALRMLRCVRFATQLGFCVEPKTYQSLKEQAHRIAYISMERIHEELEKLWCGHHLEKLYLLTDSNLLYYIDKTFAQRLSDNISERITQLQAVPTNSVLRWLVVLQTYTPEEAKIFCKKLKFDNQTTKQILTLLQYLFLPIVQTPIQVRTLAGKLGIETTQQLFDIQEILCNREQVQHARTILKQVIENGDCLNLKMLSVNGGDLMALGVPAGKQMGELLQILLNDVLETPDNNKKDYLLSIAKQYITQNEKERE